MDAFDKPASNWVAESEPQPGSAGEGAAVIVSSSARKSRDLRPAGACHCGAVQVDLVLSRAPSELRLRACQCGFCKPRGSRTIADPDGRATVRAASPLALKRYRFGLRTADYLLCAACGSYVAAVQPDVPPIGVVNVGGLAVPEFDGREAEPVDYAGETIEARLSRRRGYWMPISLVFSSAGSTPGEGKAKPLDAA